MGKILAVCISTKKGTAKRNVRRAELVAGHGLAGDAHASEGPRQVSLLAYQKIENFRAKGAKVEDGDFGENLIVEGIDLSSLEPGTFLECKDVVLEISQIGKECSSPCSIFHTMGDCIMPREGIFARVVSGGFIAVGDEINIHACREASGKKDLYRAWIITASDKAFKGEREDLSGLVVKEIAAKAGYVIAGSSLLADERAEIENELKRICDLGLADLILTTGGTGLSARDCMPEATMAAAHRLVPGIAEAMRTASMSVTSAAMLSRSVAVIRGNTLIINLPGSPKAARENLEFIIDNLRHGLDILTGRDKDCAKP